MLKASKGHFCGCLLQARYIYAAAYYNGPRGIIIIIHVLVYFILLARVFRVYVRTCTYVYIHVRVHVILFDGL